MNVLLDLAQFVLNPLREALTATSVKETLKDHSQRLAFLERHFDTVQARLNTAEREITAFRDRWDTVLKENFEARLSANDQYHEAKSEIAEIRNTLDIVLEDIQVIRRNARSSTLYDDAEKTFFDENLQQFSNRVGGFRRSINATEKKIDSCLDQAG